MLDNSSDLHLRCIVRMYTYVCLCEQVVCARYKIPMVDSLDDLILCATETITTRHAFAPVPSSSPEL